MSGYPYKLSGPIGEKGTLGLIVLQVDETIEQDFRRIFAADGYALYVSRIPSGDELTPETIAQMGIDLPQAVSLLPPAVDFDVVGYACTSGTTLIGPDRVAELIKGASRTRHTANPLNATCDALTALGARSFGLVSPYIETVAGSMKTEFERRGFAVPASISFGEEVEARVARIDPASIRDAALQIGREPGVEAVFLSCTNLRTLDIIDGLEAELGLPVVSSNLAMAWQMAGFIGATKDLAAPGRLFQTAPAST